MDPSEDSRNFFWITLHENHSYFIIWARRIRAIMTADDHAVVGLLAPPASISRISRSKWTICSTKARNIITLSLEASAVVHVRIFADMIAWEQLWIFRRSRNASRKRLVRTSIKMSGTDWTRCVFKKARICKDIFSSSMVSVEISQKTKENYQSEKRPQS